MTFKIFTVKKIKILNTNHLVVRCKLNNVFGKFIIDTGASNSCVDLSSKDKFNIICKKSNEQASSANGDINNIFYSTKNNLKINKLEIDDFNILLFDMNHINNSLNKKNIKEINGIIGGDILKKFNAKIDYKNKELRLDF